MDSKTVWNFDCCSAVLGIAKFRILNLVWLYYKLYIFLLLIHWAGGKFAAKGQMPLQELGAYHIQNGIFDISATNAQWDFDEPPIKSDPLLKFR